jgi:NAD(P)H dehydrogenase (quinone)
MGEVSSSRTAHPVVAVTGGTGAVGGRVAKILASSDVPQRLLARSPARLPALDNAVPHAFGGYADHDGVIEALRGVETLFMVSAEESEDRLEQHLAFIDAAVEAGVSHLVYTSFFGAAADCVFTLGRDHHATEEHIRASGIGYTFLRDNFYLDFLPQVVGEDGVIRGPAGEGTVSAVAREDVAAAAAAVLADQGAHVGATYHLTGRESLSFAEVAATISAHGGSEVTYHHETVAEAYESRRKWPAPEWQYDAWVSTYTAIAAGECAGVCDDVRRLIGRQPLTLAELLAAQAPH